MVEPCTPLLSVDVVIELRDRPGWPVVLIERKYPPPGWALPGGFVELGETLEQAAVREAMEETSLQVQLHVLLGCYSDPSRDLRGHTASAVYVATATGIPRARDDARNADVFAMDSFPEKLAFDHGLILGDYRRYRASGELAPMRMPGS